MFYVYEHWRPDRDECFYVGKGKGKRANDMSIRNGHHKAIQAKLLRLGMGVEVKIFAGNLTEDDAFRIEKERILFWKNLGIDLANHTDGGEGVSGFKLTEDQKNKISLTHKGKSKSREHREKIGKGNKNKIVSAESRARMSASRTGKKLTDEHKANLSLAGKGKKRSEETRKRLSDAIKRSHKEKPRSQETRDKIANAQKGVKRGPHKPETKEKMSKAAIERWSKKGKKDAPCGC
jgi:hypothetical protein